MPLAIVAATANDTNAPAKFGSPARMTAVRGVSARVGHTRRDRIRRVVEAVREVEEQGDRDDRDEVRSSTPRGLSSCRGCSR